MKESENKYILKLSLGGTADTSRPFKFIKGTSSPVLALYIKIGDGIMANIISGESIDTNILSVVLRLVISMVLGGMLGFERGRKRRPAGLRTYMIVCMASALVMMTGEFLIMRYNTGDPARLGAQVISGIGFLGAGTIIINAQQVVKGLTTAAGLWAAACMGLAVGAGFFIGPIVCGALILIIMTSMQKLEDYINKNSKDITVFVEFKSIQYLRGFLQKLRERNVSIKNIEIHKKSYKNISDLVGVTVHFTTPTTGNHEEILNELKTFPDLEYLEELG